MFLPSLLPLAVVVLSHAALAASSDCTPDPPQNQTVSQETYDDLSHYVRYASVTYLDTCDSPNGQILVQVIDEASTDTQGYIAIDDTRKEVVVAFRGTTTEQDNVTDYDFALDYYVSPGVDSAPIGTLVHRGFLGAWNSVAEGVIATINATLDANPGYGLVSLGHSLGGALASVAGISLQQNFPSVPVRIYTYGQPRVGNQLYAIFVNAAIGDRLFRSVHTDDGVPTMIPIEGGYYHHGVEYWQFVEPASPETVKVCDPSGEDPTCSASIPTGGINAAHSLYYGITLGTDFCS